MLTLIICTSSIHLFAQCAAGQVEITINTYGGSYATEKWVNISTGANGTGTIVWAQGNGTIGNSSGLLTNVTVCLPAGVTYYFNCYDQYDDGWDGTLYTVEANGVVIASNGGVTPSDGADTDGSSSWQAIAAELETSESFLLTLPTPFPTDVCENDPPISMSPPQVYDATSGKAGIAIILYTDNNASQIGFDLYDLDGVKMCDETNFPGAPSSLANNTVYVIYDNPCFNVTQTSGIPDELPTTDSGSNGIRHNASGGAGAGFYVYYYAADAIEVFNSSTGTGNYATPTALGFAPYTAATNKRTTTLLNAGANFTGLFPPPSTYEYISTGTWSGPAVTNVGTVSKTYFGSFPGLARTITVPSGNGLFTPANATVGPNSPQTYTYYSVYGAAGPAACSTTTPTTTEVDVHARPTIAPVADQECTGPTYNVSLEVLLKTYNVSVDEDGTTAFTVTATGGKVSPTTLSGTGTKKVKIEDIPAGSTWSVTISDASGANCGSTGANGTCLTVLPIDLLFFKATPISNSYIDLAWETASERDNDYFTLERSIDGITWEFVEKIKGAGASDHQITYRTTDLDPYFGQSYYRLKQTDYNGEFTYADIEAVYLEGMGKLSVYPNPTQQLLHLRGVNENVKSQVITIRDLDGRHVKNVKLDHHLKLDVSDLSSGVYFIEVSDETSIQTVRFVKK